MISTRLLRTTTLALAFAVSAAMPVAAKSRPSTAVVSSVRDLSRVHIENFGEINGKYYRGGQPSASDVADLAALGVRTIIDLQEADYDRSEPQYARNNGITYVRIPMSTHRPPTRDELARFFSIVNDPAAQPVYVHCKGGRHRTGVMTAAYRMTFDGWTSDQAFAEMKRFQFGSDFLHPEFKKYVYSFDARREAGVFAAAATSRAAQQ